MWWTTLRKWWEITPPTAEVRDRVQSSKLTLMRQTEHICFSQPEGRSEHGTKTWLTALWAREVKSSLWDRPVCSLPLTRRRSQRKQKASSSTSGERRILSNGLSFRIETHVDCSASVVLQLPLVHCLIPLLIVEQLSEQFITLANF